MGPHPADLFNDSLNAESTFTTEKPRITLSDPQLGHLGLSPSEYSEIEARMSKGLSQSLHLYSYVGTVIVPVVGVRYYNSIIAI